MSPPHVLALSLFSIFSPTPALPASCPAADLVVEVSPLLPALEVDHTKSRRDLGRLMGAKAFAGFYTQGLTDVTYGSRPRYLIETSEAAGGVWCASARRVSVEFGLLAPPKVLIASEIPEDTCRYGSVMEHELLHVGISEKAVKAAVEDLRSKLGASVGRVSPATGDSRAAATEHLKSALDDAIRNMTARHIGRAGLENAQIDTRSSYEKLTARCPGSPF